MKNLNKKLFTKDTESLKDILKKINQSGHKCLIVIDNKEKFLGTISDGDIRKYILKNDNLNIQIKKLYNKSSIKVLKSEMDETEIKKIFISKKIDLIPIVNNNNNVIDVIFWEKFFSKTTNIKNKKILNPVVIMAGGKGTRMKPYTSILPKPLLSYNGKPMIDVVIDNFKSNKFKNFFISLNYKSNLMNLFLKEKKDKDIKIIYENKPLGTVGILSKLKYKKFKQSEIILTNCDTLLNYDYSKILDFHKINNNVLTLVCTKKTHQIPYGDCEIDKDSNLKKINEKPKFNINVNIGFYILNMKILKLIPIDKKFDVTDLIKIILKKNLKIKTYIIDQKNWSDLGDLNVLNEN
tara:strand:+ start:450 stop:1502 length:1053 start_codon:yes stop_codon:yes gene_type:complete